MKLRYHVFLAIHRIHMTGVFPDTPVLNPGSYIPVRGQPYHLMPLTPFSPYPVISHSPSPHDASSPLEKLRSLQTEVQILKAKDEIRRLSLSHGQSSVASSPDKGRTEMLAMIKKSVDISSLPPAKPMVFSGNNLEYPQWKSTFNLLIKDKDLPPA